MKLSSCIYFIAWSFIHRPEDIKPELHLNVKNFLFDCECLLHMTTNCIFFLILIHTINDVDEPNEWAYGLDDDDDKMIDITDDTTGQVHELARQNSTIYVNEVGHSPDLHENV